MRFKFLLFDFLWPIKYQYYYFLYSSNSKLAKTRLTNYPDAAHLPVVANCIDELAKVLRNGLQSKDIQKF